jgi:hypothetical protein
MPVAVAIAIATGLVLALAVRLISRRSTGRIARVLCIAGADIRDGVVARHAWPGVIAASVLAVAGHAATFLVAAHAAGTSAATERLLPIAFLVLLATALPINIGGWGPREGVAAWAFAAAGLGAAQGLAVATTYGVLVIVATAPGGVVLIAGRRPGRAAQPAATPRTSRAGRGALSGRSERPHAAQQPGRIRAAASAAAPAGGPVRG